MLPTFNLPGKNVSTDKQMAMMRTYLNQLKDDTESELYDIKWENLSKPLREKLEGLDKDLVAVTDNTDAILANYVSASYIEANYLTASQIAAAYASFSYLETNYLTAAEISAAYATFSYLQTYYITAYDISTTYVTSQYLSSDFIYAGSLKASQITSGRISTQYLQSDILVTDDVFTNGRVKAGLIDTSTLQFNGLKYTNGSWSITLTLQQVQKIGGGTVWALGTTSVPS